METKSRLCFMTLKQLEVFVAIAETHSFSRGADKNCITQSTASQHIQALEEELGIRLFDRGRGGALLTEAGKLLLSRARKILAECEESRLAVRRFVGMEDVSLRVGASNTPGTCLIPAILDQFLKEYSNVRLEVLQSDSTTVIQQLVDEEVELGFVGGRFNDERIHFEALGKDTLVCAVSPDIAAKGKQSLSQAELCKVPMIVREQGSGTQKAVYEAFAGTWINKDSLHIVAVLGSSEAIKRALLNGIGYAFISSIEIAEELNRGQLTTIRIPGLNISRKFYAARRDGRELSPAAAVFWDFMLARWKTIH
ncbi:MAG TPA: selenium metabolism-associated LysR family transcriptional regulator [Syntrophobacteraceae bacterium]|nr:selenium metabolism-associated LysR family transcriptional regulator [Syntrophobacteraceae bacterium]